jgi:NAD(P)-dependent dehydrogenase (short-subunit alcohol dehydrogenase family)
VADQPRTVLVTGASNGIGRAIAKAFAAEGARVIGFDIAEQRLAALAAELPGVETVVGDVTDPDDVQRAVATAEGRLDVLCNSAGLLDELRLVDELDVTMWESVMAVNATGPFLFARAALPGMVEQGHGCIITLASIGGLRGGRAGPAYVSSKHAVVGLMRNIAATYREQGIRANCICPSTVHSGALGGRAPGSAESARGRAIFSKRGVLEPPPGHPDQIADIATFLASPAAAMINGAEIVADQGALTF